MSKYFKITADAFSYELSVNPEHYKEWTKKNPLQMSIQKWREIVKFHKKYPQESLMTGGTSTCALCYHYYDPDPDAEYESDGKNCAGCPVRVKTDKEFCLATPLEDYDHKDYDDEIKEDYLTLAKKELKFLESLKGE